MLANRPADDPLFAESYQVTKRSLNTVLLQYSFGNPATSISDAEASQQFRSACLSIQAKGDVQEGSIKDKADFLARFNVLFTNYMRLHLPKAKVQSTPDLWFTSWRDGYSDSAFEFKYFEGTGFKVSTYDVGAS
jgi:hypothetical protein